MKTPIPDRTTAGRELARLLEDYSKRSDVVVLALPRGGVPVAYEIARALGARLDLLMVRKLGFPSQPELAMGAIASGGIRVMNRDVLEHYPVDEETIEQIANREQAELMRREQHYRGRRSWPDLAGQTVILVDDGVATGATMFAAIDAIRQQQAAAIVVAVPVAPASTIVQLQERADRVLCLATPEPFFAIGQWYQNFRQVSDDEVIALVEQAWERS